MRNYSFYYFFVLALFCLFSMESCKKEDPLPPLMLTLGVADSSILNIDTTIQFVANIPVVWQIVQTGVGALTISTNDTKMASYQTPRVAGVYTLRILNQADTTEKIIRTLIVTPRATLFNALRAGGYVLSFRHGLASTGGDQLSSSVPNWWKSCESTLARQLDNPAGRVQSEKTGQAFRLLKIPVNKVISSEYCRCLQTAQLMKLVPNVETSRVLTYYVYDETNRYANTFNLIREQTISKQNTVFSTHVGFPSVPANLNPILSTLGMGDAAVFKLNPNGVAPTVVQVLTSADFTNLIK